MEAFVLDPANAAEAAGAVGAIIAEEVVVDRKVLFHKGHRIVAGDRERLALVDRPLHAVRLGPEDVHEDEAGVRLAAAIAGSGVARSEPRQSRVNLLAARKGLLRIDAAALTGMNRLPGIAVFSLYDGLTVSAGKVLAGAKITPVAIPAATLLAAEAIGARGPVVEVKAFLPLKVGVVTTEGMAERVRARFEETVERKIGWYGGTVLGFAACPNDARLVARAIDDFGAKGAKVILTGGGNTIDPLDAAVQSLTLLGAEMAAFGAPVHPGSMFWLAYRGQTPIFNLASCSMYSAATSADLVLPWIMAGERVTADDIAGLGYGGLLEGKEYGFRFPPYDE